MHPKIWRHIIWMLPYCKFLSQWQHSSDVLNPKEPIHSDFCLHFQLRVVGGPKKGGGGVICPLIKIGLMYCQNLGGGDNSSPLCPSGSNGPSAIVVRPSFPLMTSSLVQISDRFVLSSCIILLGSRTTNTQWRHKSKISEKLGRCGRQNILRPYLKIWDWDWIFGNFFSERP